MLLTMHLTLIGLFKLGAMLCNDMIINKTGAKDLNLNKLTAILPFLGFLPINLLLDFFPSLQYVLQLSFRFLLLF